MRCPTILSTLRISSSLLRRFHKYRTKDRDVDKPSLSTIVNDTPVENRIGDALVKRIIRAHRQGTKWKACIVIPLLPGFPYPIDHGDASAVSVSMRIVCSSRLIFMFYLGPNHRRMSKSDDMSGPALDLLEATEGGY